MAIAVIYELEPVEVEIADTEDAVGRKGRIQRGAEIQIKADPVTKAGGWISMGRLGGGRL